MTNRHDQTTNSTSSCRSWMEHLVQTGYLTRLPSDSDLERPMRALARPQDIGTLTVIVLTTSRRIIQKKRNKVNQSSPTLDTEEEQSFPLKVIMEKHVLWPREHRRLLRLLQAQDRPSPRVFEEVILLLSAISHRLAPVGSRLHSPCIFPLGKIGIQLAYGSGITIDFYDHPREEILLYTGSSASTPRAKYPLKLADSHRVNLVDQLLGILVGLRHAYSTLNDDFSDESDEAEELCSDHE